ncbi:hypothetical protein ACIO87_38180 [Streptomyces sp. NPDC087218]|uniref:hypothetical protein n=1 Tax=Streptomyces sp. NPDC087218 TaxID=3365769 RepID=UPI00382AD7C8
MPAAFSASLLFPLSSASCSSAAGADVSGAGFVTSFFSSTEQAVRVSSAAADAASRPAVHLTVALRTWGCAL